MKFSHTREIINPFFPCEMEGYSEERFMLNQTEEQKKAAGKGTRIAQGVRDDLLLDTLILEAGQRMVFFTLDWLIVEKEFADYCRQRVSQECNIEVDCISISCCHTHNSPMGSHGMDNNQHPLKEYWEMVCDKMVYSYKIASRYMRSGKVIYDCHLIQGYYNNRNRPEGEYFNQCIDLTFVTDSGTPIIRLLNLACHPSLVGVQNKYFTTDFFGVMRRKLQEINGTPIMIFNGEAGDVSTRLLKKGTDYNECIRYGEGIAAQLVYPNHPMELKTDELSIRKIEHRIDYNPQEETYLHEKKKQLHEKLKTLDSASKEAVLISTCYLYDIEEKLSHNRIQYSADCYVFDFGGFRIVTVPGEIDSVLGNVIRMQDDKPTLLNAYSNGFLYYAVNKEEYGEVFESYVTFYPYGDADKMVADIVKHYQ